MTSEDIVIQQPKRLGTGQTPEGLIQIEIQLRMFKLTVQESDYESRYRLGLLLADLYEQFSPAPVDGQEPQPPTDAERIRQNLLQEVWAPLASCSSGQVPTWQQFLKMPEVDIDFWVATGRSLGVQFKWLDDMQKILSGETLPDKAETKKKGAESRRRS